MEDQVDVQYREAERIIIPSYNDISVSVFRINMLFRQSGSTNEITLLFINRRFLVAVLLYAFGMYSRINIPHNSTTYIFKYSLQITEFDNYHEDVY